MINARAETLFDKPTWSRPVRSRRCLVPANAFYEWSKTPGAAKGGRKQPHLIRIADGRLFAFAGIWETWRDRAQPEDSELAQLTTFSIITTSANATIAPLHHRMPVVLRTADYDTWLDPDLEDEEIVELLQPSGLPWVTAPVAPHVGKVAIDDARCWEPAETERGARVCPPPQPMALSRISTMASSCSAGTGPLKMQIMPWVSHTAKGWSPCCTMRTWTPATSRQSTGWAPVVKSSINWQVKRTPSFS